MSETATTPESTVPLADIRPRLALFHPNQKGTGCAMTLDLHPAHGVEDGCIMASFAAQKTVGSRQGDSVKYATFDWERRISVKLDFSDLCKMLQVFRGEQEALGDEGRGLYHRSPDYSTRIVLRHLLTPVQGYSFEVYRSSPRCPEKECQARILLTPAEALGIALSFENSIGIICFGIPKVIAHDTSAYREKVRKMCHAGMGQ